MSIPDYIIERATRSIANDIEKHWRDTAITVAVSKLPVGAPFSGDIRAHAELIAETFSNKHIPETLSRADRVQYIVNEIRLASWGYTDQDVVWAAIGDQGQLMFDGLALRALADRVAREKGYSLPEQSTCVSPDETTIVSGHESADRGQSDFTERPIGFGE